MARPRTPHAREALVAAARAEFARKGLSLSRIEDITAACGLSKGAFYLHFPSKEALFGELVDAFNHEMDEAFGRRSALSRDFRLRYGVVNRRDVQTHSARWRRALALEAEEDLQTLESMWKYRDVMGVLVAGCQGTQFEGAVWTLVERETARVAAEVHEHQCHRAMRSDIPSEIFATMVVGTWFLLARNMTRLTAKPDLLVWAHALQRLLTEGSAPTAETESAAAPAATARRLQNKPKAPRSRRITRTTQRSTP